MSQKSDTRKTVAILSYFLVGIIWYFADDKVRKDTSVKFHVKQAINLFLFSIVINIIIRWLTILTFGFFYVIGIIIQLGLFFLWILGIVNAANLRKESIPFIGPLAERYLTF